MPRRPELAKFHMIPREHIPNMRYYRGELIIDTNKNDLYFCNNKTGLVSSFARDIYKEIIDQKLENTELNIVDTIENTGTYSTKTNSFNFKVINKSRYLEN